MRNALPILLIVLAAAAGWWLLTGADDELPPLETSSGDQPSDGTDPGAMKAKGPEGLAAKGTDPTKRRKPYRPLPDPRTLPKGSLVITMLGPDLKALDSGSLRVFIEPRTPALWRTKLPLYEKSSRTWRAKNVVAGPVRVRISGDHVVRRSVDAVVKRDRESTLSVTLDLAGAIRYDVIAYDKTRPEKVKLTLYDFQDRPVRAWYQERTSRRMTTPQEFQTAEIGPEGVVFGILPGRYRLRVVSPAEEWDDAEVDVVAGKTAKVSLEVRR
ncbi:MAG: hypothetical protein QNJ90_03985 [Planctomycetota bacterium]|nr:hypothetical protein [Planctomycetota bacterium]